MVYIKYTHEIAIGKLPSVCLSSITRFNNTFYQPIIVYMMFGVLFVFTN